MDKKIIVGIFLCLILGFFFLYISDFIAPYFDPRYLMLVLLMILGTLLIALGVSFVCNQTFGDNIIDMLVSIRYSGIFSILFGALLVIIGILGFIFGPDWLGMETFFIQL